MNAIANDFITIEYRSDRQKRVAEYYLEEFKRKPEFYKCILNGTTIIHSKELAKLNILDKPESYEKHGVHGHNRDMIIDSIFKITHPKHNIYGNFHGISNTRIYFEILGIMIRNNKKANLELAYHDLAYDYYRTEKDTKYLKKYLYEDEINLKDIVDLCNHKVLNYLPTLLDEKLINDRCSLNNNSYKSIRDNIYSILDMLETVGRYSVLEIRKLPIDDYESYYTDDIRKIDDETFEKLVVRTLNHIDPTYTLTYKYWKLKAEDRIIKKPSTGVEESCYQNGKIYLFTEGNLKDVIIFIHEFSHFNYDPIDKDLFNKNKILGEFHSIYYELKTAEYLLEAGYSKEEVAYAKGFRHVANIDTIERLIPNIIFIKETNSLRTKEEQYKIINKYIDKYVSSNIQKVETFNNKEMKKHCEEQLRLLVSYAMIDTINSISTGVSYVVGTYLSQIAIKKLENEEVLRILSHIRDNETSLDTTIKMVADEISGKEKVK